MMNKKIIIELTNEEAEALYNSKVNIECPMKVHSRKRRIWWTTLEDNNCLSYTLCQSCYHNNNIEKKGLLKPIMTIDLPCNCDGETNNDKTNKTDDDGYYPILLTDNLKLGIYMTDPNTKLFNVDQNMEITRNGFNEVNVTIYTDLTEFDYAYCMFVQKPSFIMIETTISTENIGKIKQVNIYNIQKENTGITIEGNKNNSQFKYDKNTADQNNLTTNIFENYVNANDMNHMNKPPSMTINLTIRHVSENLYQNLDTDINEIII